MQYLDSCDRGYCGSSRAFRVGVGIGVYVEYIWMHVRMHGPIGLDRNIVSEVDQNGISKVDRNPASTHK